GAIQLVQPYNQAGTISVSFTQGSRSVFVNTAGATPDLTGYRILQTGTPARHIIERVNKFLIPNQIQPPEARGRTPHLRPTSWPAYPATYQLPQAFVPGTSPLFLYGFPSNLPTTQTIDVVDPVDLERMYPQCFPWAQGTQTIGGGLPILAARVTQDRLRFSHFLNTPNTTVPIQIEFEYMRRPDLIAEGTIPLIPIEHRRVLSYGVAYLILNDKVDTEEERKYGMFVAAYKAMRDEHARDMRRMSSRWGVVQPPRSSGHRSIMLTETGLPVYIW